MKKKGYFIAMKAASATDELTSAEKAVNTLGGSLKEIHSFELPIEKSDRSIIIIDKVKATPNKYPRKPGTPNKMPIE